MMAINDGYWLVVWNMHGKTTNGDLIGIFMVTRW